MSVQSIGSSVGSTDWLQTLLAMYGQTDGSGADSTMETLLSLNGDASGSAAATSADTAGEAASANPVGSFNSILAALLAGDGDVAYDMETGSLTLLDAGEAADRQPATDAASGQDQAGTAAVPTDSTASTAVTDSSDSADAASGASGGGGGDSGGDDDTTTTVTVTFTDKGIEETTTVTDADGNIVSQNVKEMPIDPEQEGEQFGASEAGRKGVAGLVGEYGAQQEGARNAKNGGTVSVSV